MTDCLLSSFAEEGTVPIAYDHTDLGVLGFGFALLNNYITLLLCVAQIS